MGVCQRISFPRDRLLPFRGQIAAAPPVRLARCFLSLKPYLRRRLPPPRRPQASEILLRKRGRRPLASQPPTTGRAAAPFAASSPRLAADENPPDFLLFCLWFWPY